MSHRHHWNLTMHLDGCHFFASGYACDCGATRVSRGERDVAHDHDALIWLVESCERCAELAGGAKPTHSDEVELPR